MRRQKEKLSLMSDRRTFGKAVTKRTVVVGMSRGSAKIVSGDPVDQFESLVCVSVPVGCHHASRGHTRQQEHRHQGESSYGFDPFQHSVTFRMVREIAEVANIVKLARNGRK